MKKRITVMGVGNYIFSDEGVGVHAVQELEKENWDENIDIYDCGTLGILAYHKVVDSDVIIAVDAIASDKPAGTIIIYDKEDIMLSKVPMKISPHQIGFQETLFQAQLRGECPDVVKLIGIVPEKLDASIELSDTVSKAMPEVLKIVRDFIKEYNK